MTAARHRRTHLARTRARSAACSRPARSRRESRTGRPSAGPRSPARDARADLHWWSCTPSTRASTTSRRASKHLVEALEERGEVGQLRLGLREVEPDRLAVALRVLATDLVERGELTRELGDQRRVLLCAPGLDVDRALHVLERRVDTERIVAAHDQLLASGCRPVVAAA